MVQGIQCHSIHSSQLFDLKSKKKKNTKNNFASDDSDRVYANRVAVDIIVKYTSYFAHNSFTVCLWLLILVSNCWPIYELSDGILNFHVRGTKPKI